ncbi:MAG: FAD:protein FMN transferase [Campylobacterota bacterium]|nr:FAD:protein FMN transferase [Campylobacterota bacterium]
MKLFVTFLIFASFLQAEIVTRTKVMMGTFATVKVQEQDSHHFKNVFKTLKRVEKSLSSYDKKSPIYKLNQNKTAEINLYTYEALSLSKRYYKESGGYFNVAIGSITKDLYRFGEEQRVPDSTELNATRTSLSALAFDEKSAKIVSGVKVDLGGMGKGYGIDRAAEYLKINGIIQGSVALSGDIRCLDTCKIEVKNPFGKKSLASFTTKHVNMGITTSGNYNRYVESKEHNHLINPKTKQSERNFASITLVSTLPSSDIDAYATAASVMPKAVAYSFLNSLPLAYIVVEETGETVVSSNIDFFVDALTFHDGAIE